MKQTLDQMRAKDSLTKVNAIKEKYNEQVADDYASYVVRLPADIMSNGLGQAVAQLLASAKSKKDDPHFLVYKDLEKWLCHPKMEVPYKGKEDLLQAITTHNRYHYQWALAEALAWLEWHKKLSVAYLKKIEDEAK